MDKGVDLCLVNVQDHHIQSMVNSALYFHNQFKVQFKQVAIWRYTNFYIAYNFQQRPYTTAFIYSFGIFDIVSLTAVPVVHQEIIMECRDI